MSIVHASRYTVSPSETAGAVPADPAGTVPATFATLMLPHARLLGWVASHCARYRQAPLVAEVIEVFGQASLDWIEEMERVECLVRSPDDRIRLLTDLCELPVIGQVAAGVPIEAIEFRQEQLSLPLDLFPERPTYLLRVKGDSMINAGIHDGDLIAIKKSGHAREGAIIVARVNNEVTVKRLRIGTQQVSLLPENDAYKPICVAPADLVVEGVFVGVVRQPRGLH